MKPIVMNACSSNVVVCRHREKIDVYLGAVTRKDHRIEQIVVTDVVIAGRDADIPGGCLGKIACRPLECTVLCLHLTYAHYQPR